jgi:hypothetical protein
VNRKPAQGLLPSELTPAQFELLKAPPRPPARGIPPITEEEAQERRKRYLETIGAVLKNLENRTEVR